MWLRRRASGNSCGRSGDRNLPIYFASPGGNLDQALAMGAMLREKPAIARVARTVVKECGFEAQNSDVCLKLKQSGRVLHGDLWTRGANCNSACPYLILGATTREIAPDAVLGGPFAQGGRAVPRRRNADPQMRVAATERGMERADRMLHGYIAKMGADVGLLDLARTIKFEDMHVLTREEIARFGIDRREVVETPWIFESSSRSMVRKTVTQRKRRRQRLSHVAVAAVLFQHRAVRTGFPASGRDLRRYFRRS